MTTLIQEMATQFEKQTPAMRTKKRILVFSLDRDLAWSLAMLLDEQFEMICETNVQTLVDRIAKSLPDLLLIDMPLYGTDVLIELHRVRLRWPTVPILMLRDYRKTKGKNEKAIQELANGQLFKPMDVEIVAKSINQLLSNTSETGIQAEQDQ